MGARYQYHANNALGACLISLMMLGETLVAHRVHPNPLSPIVWSVLGSVAVGSLIANRWLSTRALRAGV